MALYATCMPLSSDTFHDKLFPCDRGDDAEYDHDHEEGLWLSMQPVCLSRRTPFMTSSFHVTEVMMLIMIMTSMPLPSDTFHHNLWGRHWCASNLGVLLCY